VVFGAGGMLGHDLRVALRGREAAFLTHAQVDITDPDAVGAILRPGDVVINSAAYTKVDDAETHEDEATAVNGVGAGVLAEQVARVDGRMVQLSTDYVFAGDATTPYPEDAPVHPLNAYGRSKAEGERLVQAVLPESSWIVRTAWIYGVGGPNFPTTMLRLAASHPTVSVVDDQLGQPTATADLAGRIVELVDVDAPAGIYHGTNSGETTWFGFAQAVFELNGLDPDRVLPTDSASFVRPAARPAYSVLGHDGWSAAGLAPMRHWRESLVDAVETGVFASVTSPGVAR
jgi:dTDP-4-dehydrorhamnose reductase